MNVSRIDGLNPYSNGSTTMGPATEEEKKMLNDVLILILMEVPQWVDAFGDKKQKLCLNPYSNGSTTMGIQGMIG